MIASGEETGSALDSGDLWLEVNRVARSALRRAMADPERPPRLRVQVSDRGTAYEVRAQTLLRVADDRDVIVVAVERAGRAAPSAPVTTTPREPAAAGSPMPTPAELEARFELSPRQAEVALLLADRLTTKEIAARLDISRHTARRHVEGVFMKLAVHERTEVRELLERSFAERLDDAELPCCWAEAL